MQIAGDGRRPTVPNPKDLLARKLEVNNGNALYALAMLLKMADEDKLHRLSELDDTSSLYEPIGHLVGILSDEVISAANEAGQAGNAAEGMDRKGPSASFFI
jgi:hypothetical protein